MGSNHVRRIGGLLKETKGQTVIGGMETMDPESNFMPPTLVKDAQMGEPLLMEEIFGPVLPVVTVDSMQDAVQKVNEICDKPLALYVYSEDQAATNYVLDNTNSGGVGVNTSLEQ